MGAAVQCESFLPGDYSMRDLSEDSNSCSWSVHCGDKSFPSGQHQIGSSSARPVADTRSRYERDFLKRTMLEHDTVFKNQVSELHRLYRVQRTLMEELRHRELNDILNHSEASPRNESSQQQMPRFLSGDLECNGPSILGGNSQACNVAMQNEVSPKDHEVLVVRPVKVRRKMIDLQLPPEEYMDTDEIGDPHDNLPCPPYERSTLGKEVGEKQFLERFNASHKKNSSGYRLGLKKLNGFADLNEPAHCQESEPVASSKDIHSLCGRNDVHIQGHCLEKDTSRSQWMVLESGHDNSNWTDEQHMPFQSVQTFSNKAFQPLNCPSSGHGVAKLSTERTYYDREARLRNPEVSYNSHVESSVTSSVPSSHGHCLEFVQPWTPWLSSWDNSSSSSSGQRFLPVQGNPFLNSNTQGRAHPSFGIRCREFNGLYQGSSSGSKEAVFGLPPINFNHFSNGSNGAISNSPFMAAGKYQGLESLQEPKTHEECSTGLSWLKPKPHFRSEVTNGCLDLNTSIHQFTDETDMADDCSNASPPKSLRSVPCSNKADLGRVEMTDFQSSRKILGFPAFEKRSVVKEEPSYSVRDINLPSDAAVSVIDHRGAEVAFVDKEESKRATRFRHHIDLNLCASEDEDSGMSSGLRVKRKATPWIDLEAPAALDSEEEAEESPEKTNEDTWGLRKAEDRNFMDELLKAAAEAIVSISISDHRCHPDEAASSSTDPVKDSLAWFADTIASCGDDLEKHIEAISEGGHSEGGREECSSGEFDYFVAMTLKLAETKEEDYMPKPLVPENLKFDETGTTTAVPNRPRRGQPRRGRPKRDFQRDILPGLTSLARHEVTEDLQMFGGLSKATGCSWNSGVARKNPTRGGSNRGRKRLVTNINRVPSFPSLMQPMNDEGQAPPGLEDRSLTGWGRATRRPRRQRCPAGNPPTVILT